MLVMLPNKALINTDQIAFIVPTTTQNTEDKTFHKGYLIEMAGKGCMAITVEDYEKLLATTNLTISEVK